MKTIANFVLGVGLALCAAIGPALAEQCTLYRAWLGSSYSDAYGSVEALGNAVMASLDKHVAAPGQQACDRPISWVLTSADESRIHYTGTYSACNYSGGTMPGGTTGNSFAVSSVEGPCPHERCSAGTTNEVNVTVGYSRTPGGADGKMAVVVSRPWEGGDVCFGGCRYSYGDPVRAWWDNVGTSSGLYRGSMDMKITGVGGTCEDEDDPAMSKAQPGGPNCPGSVGEINGKPICAGTATNPTRNDQDINSPLPSNTGNPATGSVGEGGSGPGRTPSSGGGGPEGGPGGTGSSLTPGGGGSGSGTVKTPEPGEEQAACGAPGQPPCRIDETGTPRDGASKFDGASRSADETKDGFLDAITSAKEIEAPAWTWTFQLPSGCAPVALPAFDMELDLCQWQPMIHDLMSLVWIAATIWFSIGLVGRTLGGS